MHQAWSILVLFALAAAGVASAEDAPIGRVKTASGTVALLRDGERLPAAAGDPVRAEDVVETGADGSIGITLVDNTVLSAGPNTQVALEEYRFDSSNFEGAMTADLRAGTINVVSGDIARGSPDAMKVRLPTTILGVRGTRFAVEVDPGWW